MSNNEYDEDNIPIEIPGIGNDPEQPAEENKFLFRTGKEENYLSPFATRLLKRMNEMGIGDPEKHKKPVQTVPPIVEVETLPNWTTEKETGSIKTDQDIIKELFTPKPLQVDTGAYRPDAPGNGFINMSAKNLSNTTNDGIPGQLFGTAGDSAAGVGKTLGNTLNQAGAEMYNESGGDIPTPWDAVKVGGKALGGAIQSAQGQAEHFHRSQEPTNPVLKKGVQTLVGSPLPEKHAELERQSSGQHTQPGDPKHKGMGRAYLGLTTESPEYLALDDHGKQVRELAKTQAGVDTQYLFDRLNEGALGTAGGMTGTLSLLGPNLPPADTGMFQNRNNYEFRTESIKPGDGKIIFDAASAALAKARQDIVDRTPAEYRDKEYMTTDPNKSALLSPVRMAGDILANIPDAVVVSRVGFNLAKNAAAAAESAALAAGLTPEMASMAAKKAGEHMLTYATSMMNGVQSGGSQYTDTYHKFMTMEGAKIEKHPQYQDLIKAGNSPEDARRTVAEQRAGKDGVISGLVSTACSFAADRFVKAVRTGDEGVLVKFTQEGVADLGNKEAAEQLTNR